MARVVRLRCEHLENPLAVNTPAVRLSWRFSDERAGAAPVAYQVQVGTTPEKLDAGPDLWDSGRQGGDIGPVEYRGKQLSRRGTYYWRVRCWDRAGRATAWSETAHWERGLSNPGDWGGYWLAAGSRTTARVKRTSCHYFRRDFAVAGPVAKARLYFAALGLVHAEINGQAVTTDVLVPGWSEFDKRGQYCAYDVTHLVQPEANAIGIILGEGWFAGRLGPPAWKFFHGDRPAFLAHLEVTLQNGQTLIIGSDAQWKSGPGALLGSSLYDGEAFDARIGSEGWSSPGYSSPHWRPAAIFPGRTPPLTAKRCPAVRLTETRKPVAVSRRANGEWIFDFGQNLVGWVRLRLRRPRRGQAVTIRFAEMLDQDGSLYRANLRSAKCEDLYVAAGRPEEEWEPRFTFHGFRYASISGLLAAPAEIAAVVLHNDLPVAGGFACSDPLVNRLQQNIVWSQRGNFLEVPTDCPQRDERLGWTGDAQVFFNTAAFNLEVTAFFEKWLDDLMDAQHADGAFPDVAPNVLRNLPSKGNAAWGDAGVICPWLLYLHSGDARILKRCYASMRRWIDYQRLTSRALVRPDTGFGDWLAIDAVRPEHAPTPRSLIGTAYFAHTTRLVAASAAVLGRAQQEVSALQNLHRKIVAAFQRQFVTPGGRIVGETQTGYALALAFDLLPPRQRAAAVERLVELIRSRGNHLTTGFVGTPLLCPVLSRFGRHDVAAALLAQKTYPSWLYPVTLGATTIWERWNSFTPEQGFGDVAMNSFNHYAYGAVGEWMYAVLGGIQLLPAHPGYRRIRCAPVPCAGITSVAAWHEGPRGQISVDWRLRGDRMQCDLVLPPGTSAEFAAHRPRNGRLVVDGKRRSAAGTVLLASGRHRVEYRVLPAVKIKAR